MKKPLIAVTMGDPAGIGPELCLKTLSDPAILKECIPVVFGDAQALKQCARACSLPEPETTINTVEEIKSVTSATIFDCSLIKNHTVTPATINALYGRVAYACIESAVSAVLDEHLSALVTAPLNKESLKLAGIPHPGHTEILAELTSSQDVCMMFICEDFALSLATIHIPFANISENLTKEMIVTAIKKTNDVLKRLGKNNPSISVCGLNPHAGENGLFGKEEQRIILPAIESCQKQNINCHGPAVPDTAFLPEKLAQTDAVIAMYHDQGLIPFKMLAFDKGVNVTLGLPIVRTSVDHGTAFDIAWQGIASCNSLRQSILWAKRLYLAK